MKNPKLLVAAGVLALLAAIPSGATAASNKPVASPSGLALQAPDSAGTAGATGDACTVTGSSGQVVYRSSFVHCYTPQQITANYSVDAVHAKYRGEGQTIVLVDSYGSPTAAQDLNTFYTQFYKA